MKYLVASALLACVAGLAIADTGNSDLNTSASSGGFNDIQKKYDSVRGCLKGNKLDFKEVSPNVTTVKKEVVFFPVAGFTARVCKEIGGDNLYLNDKPFINPDGSTASGISNLALSLFGQATVFDPKDNTTWVCKTGNKEIFTSTRTWQNTRDSLNITHSFVTITFNHAPEESFSSDIPNGKQDIKNLPIANANDAKTKIAFKVAKYKTSFFEKNGNITYIGSYGGLDTNSCEQI
ncbi:MAG: hypothetical protein RL154_1457, partial [Pseudomonadota bacterium]